MFASDQALQTIERDLERDKTDLAHKERELQVQERVVGKAKEDLQREELKLTGIKNSVDEIKRKMETHRQAFKRMDGEIKKIQEKDKK